MARARNLKPGFFKNEDLAELGPFAMLLFEGLWCLADKEGRLEDRPKRIKAEIFPYFDVNVDAVMNDLAGAGFIVRYQAHDEHFVQVVHFTKHQRPHSNETESVIPACAVLPSKEEGLSTKVDSAVNQGEQRFGLDTDTRNTDSLIPDTGLLDSRAPARDGEVPYQVLEQFCAATDRDIGKLTTREKNASLAVAKRLLADGVSCEEVRGFVAYLAAQDWRTNPVTLFTVEKEIGTWRASGAPLVPKARGSPQNGRPTSADLFTAGGKRVQERHDERGRNRTSAVDDQHALLADNEHGRPQRGSDDRDVDDGALRHPIDAVYRERA